MKIPLWNRLIHTVRQELDQSSAEETIVGEPQQIHPSVIALPISKLQMEMVASKLGSGISAEMTPIALLLFQENRELEYVNLVSPPLEFEELLQSIPSLQKTISYISDHYFSNTPG
ncbi:hypothetical protein [Ammoniphilus sp. 3BR4]|uniref:hypothetical protein n=1 Tax=Ammoniphilus sp. 3BR4 TaxID=3158265 RepID=UPI003467AD7A